MRKKGSYQTIMHPLDPVFREDSRILILGSFPSVKTREYGFFYGHPQNRFWPLMEILFEEVVGLTPEKKKAFLLRQRIALYDVIYQCDIIGSSDASVKNVVPANLEKIVREAKITRVYCNGGTAYKYYQKYQAKQLDMEGVRLPSTSPANARYRLKDLVEAWSQITS